MRARRCQALSAISLVAAVGCSSASGVSQPQGLSVVSVKAAEPQSPVRFTVTGLLKHKTVQSASVAAFEVTIRNEAATARTQVTVTLVIDQAYFAPLAKTLTVAAIAPRTTRTVSFERFHGAVFTKETVVDVALDGAAARAYRVAVPWA